MIELLPNRPSGLMEKASHFGSERMICSDEGLTLEKSAFQSLYGGQFTLSTPSINQSFVNNASVASPPVLEYIINSGLHILSTWLRQSYLQINASKTQTMTLGPVPYR